MTLNLPFKVLIKRVAKKIFPKKKFNYHLADLRINSTKLSIKGILKPNYLPEIKINTEVINHYLNHEFNYLGSGWISQNNPVSSTAEIRSDFLAVHTSVCITINNQIDKNYKRIDWQKDITSDYDFDINNPFNKQKIKNDVDIKRPWELGRLQHLPRLALFAIHATNKNELVKEFKNQSLDFIANNPIGMGVQWACTMDVGIRVSNLLIAYDVFSQIDEDYILDDDFKKIFTSSIYHHGQFIFNHLEYKEGLAGNHYLFNLSGLLFVSTYLEKNDVTTKWLEFSMQEIEKEYFKQFFNDGGNFEGSTAYHCLSAEMIIYSTALMLRNNYVFSEEFKNRLCKSALFVLNVLKPNGEIPQFGDNDSGRYFKLSYLEKNNDENLLNYEGLIAAFSGLIDNNSLLNYKTTPQIAIGAIKTLENAIISNLANGLKIECGINELLSYHYKCHPEPIEGLTHSKKHEIAFGKIENLIENLSFIHYPDFGLSIFKSANFYLAISSISNKKMHHSWGHVHNDKLSFELFVNDVDYIKDAGSYCYTSDVVMRNKFRSTKAHHTIIINGIEQNKFISSKNGLFYLERESQCELLELTKNSIKLKVEYYGIIHIRKFEIFEDKIIISDYCNKDFEQNFNTEWYSSGYGKMCR